MKCKEFTEEFADFEFRGVIKQSRSQLLLLTKKMFIFYRLRPCLSHSSRPLIQVNMVRSCSSLFKSNDVDQLKKDIETNASCNLQEFKDALLRDDKQTLKQLTTDGLLKVIKRAEENNKVLIPKIFSVTSWIKSLSDRDLNGFFASKSLYYFVSVIDGKRDNISYYTFDAGREWIERRLDSTSGAFNRNLRQSRDLIVSARDDLDSNAQIFVQGVKKIKELSSAGKAGSNGQEIRNVVSQFEEMKQNMKLTEKTETAINKITQSIESLS